MKVYFKSEKEAKLFRSLCEKRKKRVYLYTETSRFLGNKSYVVYLLNLNCLNESLAKCCATLFVELRLAKFIRSILKDVFYYDKEVEITMISNHIFEIFKKRLYLYDEFNKKYSPYLKLVDFFEKTIQREKIFQYDHLLQHYKEELYTQLIDIVSVCIDEYKSEEEYQMFLQSIREYLQNRKAIFKEIYIFKKEKPIFFTKYGDQISKETLQSFMKKDILFMLSHLATDDFLAPLIALNPEKIYVYGTKDISNVKTTALLNIFEERVKIKNKNEFPFSHMVS